MTRMTMGRIRLLEDRETPAAPAGVVDYAALRRDLAETLRRACPYWLGDRRDDLVQASLMRVMEVHRKSEGKRELSSYYLRRVAHSVLVDEIRRVRRRREVSLEEERDDAFVAPSTAGPENVSVSRQIGRGIHDCLQRLVPPRQLAVTLQLQGHTLPEISRLLSWKLKRAENLVYRGLVDLRKCLAEKGLRP